MNAKGNKKACKEIQYFTKKEVKVPRGSFKTAFKEAKSNLFYLPLHTYNAYFTEFQFKYVIPISTSMNRVKLWNVGIYNS